MTYESDIEQALYDYRGPSEHKELLRTLLSQCESPLELRALFPMMKHFMAEPSYWIDDDLCLQGFVQEFQPKIYPVVITPQKAICVPDHTYRVDYLVRVYSTKNDDGLITHPLLKVVVEIDGHDWHERTKEQAARDKERDRNLQIEGYRTLRFTGSEVNREVWCVAGETLGLILNLASVPFDTDCD